MPRPKSPVDWLMTWSNVNVTTHELPPFRNTSTIFKLIHNNLQWCLLKNATNQEVYMELPSRKMKEFLKETEIEQLVGPFRISCSLCFQYPSFPQLFFISKYFIIWCSKKNLDLEESPRLLYGPLLIIGLGVQRDFFLYLGNVPLQAVPWRLSREFWQRHT